MLNDLTTQRKLNDLQESVNALSKQLAEIQQDLQYVKRKLYEQKDTGEDNNGKESR